jgi:membrane-associated phospholipid phosphatase
LVAWARVAAHVHHAEDVVAGLAIGAAAGLIAVLLVRRLLQSLLRRSERLRTMAGTGRP